MIDPLLVFSIRRALEQGIDRLPGALRRGGFIEKCADGEKRVGFDFDHGARRFKVTIEEEEVERSATAPRKGLP